MWLRQARHGLHPRMDPRLSDLKDEGKMDENGFSFPFSVSLYKFSRCAGMGTDEDMYCLTTILKWVRCVSKIIILYESIPRFCLSFLYQLTPSNMTTLSPRDMKLSRHIALASYFRRQNPVHSNMRLRQVSDQSHPITIFSLPPDHRSSPQVAATAYPPTA